MPVRNLTGLLPRLLQLINITLQGNQPTTKMLPQDQDTLDGITELRTQIHYVSDPDAKRFQLRVLGCIKGKLQLTCCRHKSKTIYSTIHHCRVLLFSNNAMPPQPYRLNSYWGKTFKFQTFPLLTSNPTVLHRTVYNSANNEKQYCYHNSNHNYSAVIDNTR